MQNKKAMLIFLISFIFIAVFTKHSVDSGNDASRIATIESLVERGNFIIDNSALNVSDHQRFNDKIFYNGHFYTSKPPVLSYVSAPPYYILHNFFGLKFKDFYQPSLAYYLTTLFTMGVFYALLVAFFYLFLIKKKVNEKDAILLTIALAIGTLMFVFAAVFNDHIASASFLFISFYIIYFYNTFKSKKLLLLIAGILGGFAVAFEPPVIIIFGFIALLLAKEDKHAFNFSIGVAIIWFAIATLDNYFIAGILSLGLILLFYRFVFSYLKNYHLLIIGFVLPIILYAYLNMQIIESPLPQHLHPDNDKFYTYPGAPWPSGHDPTGDIPRLEFFFHSTIGYRGLFSYSPVLIFGLIGMWKLRKRNKIEILLITLAILSLYAYYTFGNSNYGGDSYGSRRLIPLTPFILYFASDCLKNCASKQRRIFYITLAASIIFALIGVYKPWSEEYGYKIFFYQPIPLLDNIKNFVEQYIIHR